MADSNNEDRSNTIWRLGRWGAPIIGVLVVVLALAGISVSQAESATSDQIACNGDDCEGDGHKRWGKHRRGGRWFGHRGHDPERAKEHMQYATGWMMKRLDVEDDARDEIEARLDSAFDELVPLFESHKGARANWLESMLGEDGVDRQELAAQSEQAMLTVDSAMQIVTTAMADVAELLTPEQRAEIAEKIRKHRH
ncbi:MAG: protein CpxP [Myxococcota bacterium]|jgi:protein CpxP